MCTLQKAQQTAETATADTDRSAYRWGCHGAGNWDIEGGGKWSVEDG